MRNWTSAIRVTGLAAAGFLVGCGGAQFGADARVPLEARHVVKAGTPAGQALSLPGERGFNIHIKESSQNLGSGGQSTGHSDATAQGNAFAEAVSAKGGSARAEFKIGHRVDNLSGATQQMTAQVRFVLKHAVQASEPPAVATLAKADLLLVVVDQHKRAVSKSIVVQANSDDSVGSASLPQQRELTVRLEPGGSYDVVLFGQVQADAADAQEATARLDIEQLKMELTFAAVASQPAAQAVRE